MMYDRALIALVPGAGQASSARMPPGRLFRTLGNWPTRLCIYAVPRPQRRAVPAAQTAREVEQDATLTITMTREVGQRLQGNIAQGTE